MKGYLISIVDITNIYNVIFMYDDVYNNNLFGTAQIIDY